MALTSAGLELEPQLLTRGGDETMARSVGDLTMRDPHRTFVRLIAVLALSSGPVAFAQTAAKPAPKPTARPARPTTTPVRTDPFVGVWRLSAEKSKYESGGPPKGFTRTYEDRGDGTIVMITDVVNAQGATTRSYLVYKRDGKPYPEAALGVESIRLVTVKAVDRNTEEMAFTVSGKPVENTTTITVSVSADGRTMTQVLSGKTGQGRTFTNTLIFDKQ
jgi:hypothetical protein